MPKPRPAPRVGIYCRISLDAEEKGEGVKRQEDDCRALCASRGYEVVDVYVDGSNSAYSGKRRPEYERLLSDLGEGRINGVVVYNLDRLHRRPVEPESFIDLAQRTKATLATVTGDVDLSTHEGQLTARIMGAVAKKASDDASRRLQRKWIEDAKDGKPKHGGKRPFGYEPDKVTVRESEAEVLREAVARVLSNETVYAVVKDFNERGITTTSGNVWGIGQLRRVLVNPRNTGLRSYKGEPIGEAAWPAIINEDDHKALVQILTNPARRTTPGNAREHLLSGFLHCGECECVSRLWGRLESVPMPVGQIAGAVTG